MVIKSLLEKALSITPFLEWVPTKLVYEAGDTVRFTVPVIKHDETRGSSLRFLNFDR